jgi:hypothetical protein
MDYQRTPGRQVGTKKPFQSGRCRRKNFLLAAVAFLVFNEGVTAHCSEEA